MPYASERSKRRRCEGAGGTTPLERQVGMQIGSRLFAYDFGYKIIFLLDNNVKEDHIIYLALDDTLNNHLLNPLALESYIRNLIKDDDNYYIMIDEIQRVFPIVNPIFTEGKIKKAKKDDQDAITFVNIILGFMQLDNIDLYISGGNSKFLSRDIMTEFRDRGDEIHM